MKPAIIDIDDVILQWTKGFSRFVNYDLTTSSKRIHQCLGVTTDEEVNLIEKFNLTSDFGKLEFIEGAAEGVSQFKRHYEVIFVTSCGQDQRTKQLRLENMSVVASGCDIIFLNTHQPKNEVINKIKPELIIDDNFDNVAHAVYNGSKGYIFETPWTVGKDFKAYTWKDIIDEHFNTVFGRA